MDLLAMRYFKDAAELENFSEVAKKNYVPQPSISYAIKKLENEYGVKLFTRKGKHIFLNENGNYLYGQVCEILNILDQCEIHFNSQLEQKITLYIQDSDFFIPPLTADFVFKYPNVNFLYSTVDEVMRASKPPYDFTFMLPLDDMSDYNYELIFEDELRAIVSKDHPLAKYDTINISQLENEEFVGLYDTIPLAVLTNKFCQEVGHFFPQYVFKSGDDFATIHRVSKSNCVALLPYQYYCAHPSKNIKTLKIENTVKSQLILAWDKSKILTSTEQLFVDFCKEWFKQI